MAVSSALVKVKDKSQITLPATLRREHGIAEGDYLEAKSTKDGILLKPKTFVDRVVEPALKAGLADLANGRVTKAFSSGAAIKRAMKTTLRRA